MDNYRENGNVIEIIGGDGSFDNQMISGNEFSYDGIQSPKSGNEPPIMETRNQSFGFSSFMVENQRSYIDQCGFLHDEGSRIRERNSIILTPQIQSSVGFGYGGGNGNGNRGQVATNANVKPANWKTKICNKWEQAGYCPFGSRCTFAHGPAELQRYGGGLVHQEANPNNQRLMFSNNVAPASSSVAHAVAPASSSVARAGGSGQLPGMVRKRWKGPDKISRIYGDWIDDL